MQVTNLWLRDYRISLLLHSQHINFQQALAGCEGSVFGELSPSLFPLLLETNLSCAVFNALTYGYGLAIGSHGLQPRGLHSDGLLANGGTTS